MMNIDLTQIIKDADLSQYALQARQAQITLADGARQDLPGYGWQNLPYQDRHPINQASQELSYYNHLIIIGIGGSSLGLEMLTRALIPQYWNEDQNLKAGRPQIFIADNLDASENARIWSRVDPKKTCLVVVSKSGRTLETLGNFLYFRDQLSQAIGETLVEGHIFIITDPNSGLMRDYAQLHQIHSISLPTSVGGRYSVLSTAALPIAQTLGIDAGALLEGAKNTKEKLDFETDYQNNPSLALACALCHHHQRGRAITVFMPYGDKLEKVSSWFAQLWGESLGKNGIGFTPQSALGSIDQHSQLQLYSQGPDDKTYIFLNVAPDDAFPHFQIPLMSVFDEVRYLQNLPMEQALDNERRGVITSLTLKNRPIASITMPDLTPQSLGSLIYFLEHLTATVGLMLGINPFDQPGVEEGKNFALALCGQPQSSDLKKQALQIEKQNSQTRKYSV